MAAIKQVISRILTASTLVAAAFATLGASASAQPMPAAGHPGCYAKIAYPAIYRTVTERVAAPPVIRYRDVPPVIEHYLRPVLVTPARVEQKTFAPVYRTQWRWVERPGPVRQVFSPPVYRTITERRLISPAHLAWRAGGAAHGFAPGYGYGQGGGLQARPTGEVLCRILVPARYAWTSRHVMVSSGRQTTIHCPPRHVRVSERVMVQPGRTVQRLVPAVYAKVDATRVVRPASRQRIVCAGEVRLVSRRVLVRAARYGWAPMVCTPRQRPAPIGPHPIQSYGAGPADGMNPAYSPPTQMQPYGGYGEAPARPARRPYRSDEIVAPAPAYPATQAPPLVPAPYEVGHPARR